MLEIFGSKRKTLRDEIREANYLEDRTLYKARIQLTLSHPRTAPFKRMTSSEQEVMYLHHFNHIINDVNNIKDSSSFFETSKDGHRHLHAHLYIESDYPFFIEGLVQEVCKAYFKCLPKRYNTYRSCDYYPQWDRYKSPMICCQYVEINDLERATAWDEYIRKSQPIL